MNARASLRAALDLFAGPGGWDEGIRPLGIRPLGIEWDEGACATRKAAGHSTLRADVAELNPLDFERHDWQYVPGPGMSFHSCRRCARLDLGPNVDPRCPVDLLIASPPCQAFSVAGKRGGRDDAAEIVACAANLMRGFDTRATVRPRLNDERSLLVVEPLRWALALRPRWIALEQVPPVLELWEHFGDLLADQGYDCWAGVLSAERYGVPQTRQRAFLLASLNETPHPPMPTHQEYVYGVPAAEQHTLEGTLAPWVSMADALGWGMSERPSVTVTAQANRGGGAAPLDGGSGARETLRRERREGRWYDRRQGNTQSDGSRKMVRLIPDSEPAPTISGGAGDRDRWVFDRPATTIACDPRVFQPGGHHEPGKQSENAIPVTLEEAAILQGFPADYPWQGSTNKERFGQVGNAVPPPLARAVVAALVGSEALEVAA